MTDLVPAAPRASRITDDVVRTLLDAIVDGRYPTGDRLPPERELAAALEVNRTSLRQAIGRLQQMGVVEARQGRGTTVLGAGIGADPAVMAHLVARDRGAMLAELFEVRTGLAALIGRLAAARATEEERADLRQRADTVRHAADATEAQARELAFFGGLVAACRNRPLAAMQHWNELAYGDAAAQFTAAFATPEAVAAELDLVVDAVDAANPESAAAAMVAYAEASATRMLAAVADREGDPP